MTIAKGPRPWSIHAFAALILGVGIWDLAYSLTKLHRSRVDLLGSELGEDGLIVYHSAMFTIICIPVIAVWLFKSRIARWLITIFTVCSMGSFAYHFFSGRWERAIAGMSAVDLWDVLGTKAVLIFAVALLFVPASQAWFAKKEVDPATFG